MSLPVLDHGLLVQPREHGEALLLPGSVKLHGNDGGGDGNSGGGDDCDDGNDYD